MVNSTLYVCPGCGASVIGHETCGDPTRPDPSVLEVLS